MRIFSLVSTLTILTVLVVSTVQSEQKTNGMNLGNCETQLSDVTGATIVVCHNKQKYYICEGIEAYSRSRGQYPGIWCYETPNAAAN